VVLPAARPGLVFRYEYIWKRQDLAGQTVAEKERPACIVLAVERGADGQRVLIVPITTQVPKAGVPAMVIPKAVKRHLGLNEDRSSWIILSEANVDVWPSPDMRPIPGQPGRFDYGLLPLRMITAIRQALLAALAEKQVALVNREGQP
jgi:mRNA-degrading endonuclease toxin of MazEF toxin-antitoxin module